MRSVPSPGTTTAAAFPAATLTLIASSHYAGQNQFKLHLAVTYVAVVEPEIVGFATVAASSVERASVPSARLRKRLPAYPLPVLRLARWRRLRAALERQIENWT